VTKDYVGVIGAVVAEFDRRLRARERPAAEAASLLAFIPWPEGHGFYRRLAKRGLMCGVGPTTDDRGGK